VRRSVLPAVPPPRTGESFSGWLGRLSGLYAASPAGFLRAIGAAPTPYDADRPEAGLLATLCRATGVPTTALRRAVLHVSPAPDPTPPGVSRSRRGAWWMAGAPLYEDARRWCPCCLGADGALWPLAWRLGAPVCFRHGVWLERRCPGCGAVQDFRPLAPSPICGRCATPFAMARPAPYPAAITELLAVIDRGLARFAGRGEARPPRSSAARDEAPDAGWRRLIALARENAGAGASDAGDERDRLAAFLAAAVDAGILAEPVPACCFTEQAAPDMAQPRLLDGISRRVDAAITHARRTLAARGTTITAATLAREADRVLRRTPDPSWAAASKRVSGASGCTRAPING
jgi:hypothetical protein